MSVGFRFRHADVLGAVGARVPGAVPLQLADEVLQIADADRTARWDQVALVSAVSAAVGADAQRASAGQRAGQAGQSLAGAADAAAGAHDAATSAHSAVLVVIVETPHGQVVGRREIVGVRLGKRLPQLIRQAGRTGTSLAGSRTPQSLYQFVIEI